MRRACARCNHGHAASMAEAHSAESFQPRHTRVPIVGARPLVGSAPAALTRTVQHEGRRRTKHPYRSLESGHNQLSQPGQVCHNVRLPSDYRSAGGIGCWCVLRCGSPHIRTMVRTDAFVCIGRGRLADTPRSGTQPRFSSEQRRSDIGARWASNRARSNLALRQLGADPAVAVPSRTPAPRRVGVTVSSAVCPRRARRSRAGSSSRSHALRREAPRHAAWQARRSGRT